MSTTENGPAEPSPPVPFDVCGPLPSGTTVLEASAGTGKTYTIAALAARYVAEGRARLDQLLLVTFGRMATSELRARVRERLVATERALAAVTSATPPTRTPTRTPAGTPASEAGDRVQQFLLTGSPAELGVRHERVRRALADFDAATIATTHEFCLQMLDGLGVLGDREPEQRIVEHLTDLTHEVAGDVFLARYADGQPPMTYEEAVELAERVIGASHTRLVPDDAERTAYALAVRAEVERRKRDRGLFSYDDMLTRLRDALADPDHGDAACERLRRRYAVVLVDEFQDTDPVQWDILRRAFHQHATVIVIGDPKQAIYAFRGADVFSYLGAVGEADAQATLETNWRSDGALVEACLRLMAGAALGDHRIVVRQVASAHPTRRLVGPGVGAPFRLRVLPRGDEGRPRSVGALRGDIEADLVADVTALLASDARLRLDPLDPTGRPVEPSDIAVLVRKNSRGEAIRDALIAAGVPAVLLSATSVFTSPIAQEWLTLLRTLDHPRTGTIRQAALTCFVGWTFTDLAGAEEEKLNRLTWRIRSWSRLLSRRGVAALLEAVTTDTGLTERLLGQLGGERALTDLRHIGQSLHAAMQGQQLGVAALVEWLSERIEDAHRRSTEGSRRLDTEARSVAALTVHASKGLQFPIVYLPEAWDTHVPDDDGRALLLHERGDGSPDDCLLDVGGLTGPGRRERLATARREEAGEDLRLLYVGLTRAQCQVVTWWAPSARNTGGSALHRFLCRDRTPPILGEPAPGEDGVLPAASYPTEVDPLRFTHLGPQVALEPVAPRAPTLWQRADPEGPGGLAVRTFDRTLDVEWRRTSYSALTAAAHGIDLGTPTVGSEPEVAVEDDEPIATDRLPPGPADVSSAAQTAGLDRPSPMASLPMGTEFGTAVHAVLETVDPAAEDLAAGLLAAAAEALARTSYARPRFVAAPGPGGAQAPDTVDPSRPALTAQALADGLLPALRTPLGPIADELTLADLGAAGRLAELEFELPLAGGDRPLADVRLGDIAALLAEHVSEPDPLAAYPALLASPLLSEQTLRGFLTGSIDAVLRLPSVGGQRYLVVDYKTNWLGAFDGPELTLACYTPDRLAQAMMSAHYPLQALLYSVALHRLLRWRQPDYDPDYHLGGIAYLFVRGMAGPDTPRIDGQPCGVFGWRAPAGLVPALSDLLDRGPKGARR